jgi:hypothetical protein
MTTMTIVDTCVLIFDALDPKRLITPTAKQALNAAEQENQLFCRDIVGNSYVD